MTAVLLVLAVPSGEYLGIAYKPTAWMFATLMFVLGSGMGIGKASVFKYIPDYFPNDVGAVGGLVGMLGALGGFFLPPLFGALGRSTGVPQMAFAALLLLSVGSLAWLHLTVMKLRLAAPAFAPAQLRREPVVEQAS
jgi:NNP family nitrate/nitrite transporter-like MFS transporter